MLKKILAFALAGAMVIASMNMMAFAAQGDLHINNTLTVSGLETGDKVTVYQVIDWDPDHSITYTDDYGRDMPIGWVWGPGVTAGGNVNDALLKEIVGAIDGQSMKDGSGLINASTAGILGAAANTKLVDGEEISGTTWTGDVTKAGLYMVIVDPAKAGVMYNPIFVAANWYGDGEDPDTSNSIAISLGKTYSDKAMAKKSQIPLDKKAIGTDAANGAAVSGDPTNNYLADGAYTNDVGEAMKFQITTHVPKYGTNYTNPVFEITDNLNGLELTDGVVTVYKYDAETETKGAEIPAANVYTITGNSAGSSSYTINFLASYMQGNDIPVTGQGILIEYSAKVNDDAEQIVNQDDNTVDLKFSSNPEDSTDYGFLRDQTNHFTFSIDADLLGHGGMEGSSTEGIKVGVDAEGNPIVESVYYAWSTTYHAPLEGAEFKLYKDEACTQLYTNDVPFDGTVTSDSTGRITIKGLDAGTYYLKETKAPTGFIGLQDTVKVTITADITETRECKDEIDAGSGKKVEVTYITNALNSYSVEFENLKTHAKAKTSYHIDLSESSAEAIEADRETPSSDFEFPNTKGVELPSTGGIGTTLFYAGGAVLVLLAGVLLVSKRRIA